MDSSAAPGARMVALHDAPLVRMHSTMVLEFTDAAATAARSLLQTVLEEHGASQRSREDAVTVLHELAANALDHGAPDNGTLTVSWRLQDGELEVRVRDGGVAGEVAVQPLDLEAARGRGLRMVEAFSERWTVERDDATEVTAWVAIA